MHPTVVKVPSRLLLDRHLAATAKLLWMVLQERPRVEPVRATRTLVSVCGGLTRPTVVRGLAQLESAGWLSGRTNGGDDECPHALIPAELLQERRVGVLGRLVYGVLQLTSGYRSCSGEFTYSGLTELAGASRNALKQAVRALAQHGWLQISQRNKFAPIYFSLDNPVAQLREQAVAALKAHLAEAPFLGEALMRAYLSLLVDSHEYDDDASPGYLVNPFTGEEMQFDRYYPPRVAFEFNGPQHYGPTARFSSEMEARKQQGRDYIKIGIAVQRGIRLVIVHPEDLSLATMQRKVAGLLPLRSLDGDAHLITFLESVSRAYRRKARREGAATATQVATR